MNCFASSLAGAAWPLVLRAPASATRMTTTRKITRSDFDPWHLALLLRDLRIGIVRVRPVPVRRLFLRFRSSRASCLRVGDSIPDAFESGQKRFMTNESESSKQDDVGQPMAPTLSQ